MIWNSFLTHSVLVHLSIFCEKSANDVNAFLHRATASFLVSPRGTYAYSRLWCLKIYLSWISFCTWPLGFTLSGCSLPGITGRALNRLLVYYGIVKEHCNFWGRVATCRSVDPTCCRLSKQNLRSPTKPKGSNFWSAFPFQKIIHTVNFLPTSALENWESRFWASGFENLLNLHCSFIGVCIWHRQSPALLFDHRHSWCAHHGNQIHRYNTITALFDSVLSSQSHVNFQACAIRFHGTTQLTVGVLC